MDVEPAVKDEVTAALRDDQRLVVPDRFGDDERARSEDVFQLLFHRLPGFRLDGQLRERGAGHENLERPVDELAVEHAQRSRGGHHQLLRPRRFEGLLRQ